MNLKKLNWYELQREIYAAWRIRDKPETRAKGTKMIHAVYDEYARRGVNKVIRPAM